MLTAETGLLDGHEVTIHWVIEDYFREHHPEVVLRVDETLVVSGEGGRLITSGAATAWHDLVLYLIAQHVGPATAQAMARFYLLEWHSGGQVAFQVFNPKTDHGDAVVLAGAALDRRELLGRGTGGRDGPPLGPQHAHLQAALQAGHRRDDDLVCPARPGGAGEAHARDRRACRSRRSAGPWATKTQPRSAGCSSGSPA